MKNTLIAALLGTLAVAGAGEIGHQAGAAFNPGDFFAPPEGFILAIYGNHYGTTALRDSSGNKLTGFDISGTRVNLDIEVESIQVIPMIIWSPGLKLLGADVSTLVMPIYGQTSIAADLSALNRPVSIDEDAWGFQDSYVQPLWLTWRSKEWDFSTSYGFWAPTGSYDPAALDNTGAGFWSHVFRASAAWSVGGLRQTLFNASIAYETNGDKDGLDLTPGDHLTLDVGMKHVFNPCFEAGLFGYGQWQTTDDTGFNAAARDTHDRLFGMGAYASWWFVPQKASLLFRHVVEFGGRDRFEGRSTALGVNYVF
jgi:hypothetical protein